MKTIFFGASKYVIPIADVLFKNFDLSLVFTTEKNDGDLIKFCKENNIEYLSVSSLDEKAIEKIEQIKPDLGVVADFGIIISQEVVSLFPKGILNIHPSLLPLYRGSTPVQGALLNGEKTTGVSLIKIDSEVDHGPILAQEEYEIDTKDNTQTLLDILFKEGALLLDKNLEDYYQEDLIPEDQNDSNATFTKILSKNDGFIDFKSPPTKEKISNMIRAFYPWPGVWTKAEINGKEVIVKLLPNDQIQVEGKKPQSFKDFENGYDEGKDILKKLGLT
jgi:methionyl-tRNA formyltransferase